MDRTTPILTREMLWTEKTSMEEFFELDPINEEFFNVFITLREEPFAVKADEVKVFNEVYYQATRMVFESPSPYDLEKYIADIKANMGWNYSAELVMSMAYHLILLIEKHERPLSLLFRKAINARFSICIYWAPFRRCFERIRRRFKYMAYHFIPCPREAEWFEDKYIQWKKITRDYDHSAIINVINLWDNHDDRSVIAKMIQNSIVFSNHFIGKDVNTVQPILDTLATYQLPKKNKFHQLPQEDYDNYLLCEEMPSYGKNNKEESENEKLRKNIEALQSRIKELEADNERLTALLEKKKRTGTARKFTLVQIVDYCKECVEWDDAKSIVAMLNKLLRRIATDEDSELVDSIEREFFNRRYGNTYVKEQNVFPHVGNYKPEIKTQNMNLPMTPTGHEEQRLLENE